jgi:hypothetical protein
MRVLISCIMLAGRSGGEVVTADYARALKDRGHEVAVYTPQSGPLADELRAEGVTIVANPTDCPFLPEIIHGHHRQPTVTALAAFPGVPAIFLCQASAFWSVGPPDMSRIRRYLGVDEACRDRIVSELPRLAGKVGVLLNAVDLDRFQPRPPLPAKPRRALLLTKWPGAHDAAIKLAAAQTGLDLHELGRGAGGEVNDLHQRLHQYDIVFASARCAIESLVVGCAVIVVDQRGLAGMVTQSNVEAWRRDNFGLRLLVSSVRVASIEQEIARYSAVDAAKVAVYMRTHAGLGNAVDELETIYRDVIEEAKGQLIDTNDELEEIARFLAEWSVALGDGMNPETMRQDKDFAMIARRVGDLDAEALRHRHKLDIQELLIASLRTRLGEFPPR